MTNEEKWFRRLQRCLREMPNNVEISVSHFGVVSLRERGATDQHFKKHGDVDNVNNITSFRVKNIRGEESSI